MLNLLHKVTILDYANEAGAPFNRKIPEKQTPFLS